MCLQAVLTAQASFRPDEGNHHVESQVRPAATCMCSMQWMLAFHDSLLVVQLVSSGPHASNGNDAAPSTSAYPPGALAGTHVGPSSAGGFSQDPHGALADETISLGSASHSVGASRAALAGSSFADSEVSAERHPHHGLDMHSSAHDYSALETSGAAPAYEGGVGKSGVQVSSTPILGGEGTYTVQPLLYASSATQQEPRIPAAIASDQIQGQYAPAAAASHFSQGYTPSATPSDGSQGQYMPTGAAQGQYREQVAPAVAASDPTQRQGHQALVTAQANGSQNQEQYTPAIAACDFSHGHAASYSSYNSSEGLPESRQVDDSSAIGVGRSSAGTDALQRGRAEAADSGLQDERSLRSFYSSGIHSRCT